MDRNEVVALEDRGFIQVKGVEAKDFLQKRLQMDQPFLLQF